MVISAIANRKTDAELELLLAKARHLTLQMTNSASSDIILELCAAVESLHAGQSEMRREVFREAVHGVANAIRHNQVPPTVPWSQNLPGAYGSNELLAQEIERVNTTEPVTLGELRQLRQKLKSANEGSDDLDEAIKRVYYGKCFERLRSTETILPPGSPSRSLDLAALIVQRVLPNGWWTMGSSGENLEASSVAKVGTWTGDNPKPEAASTTPLTLLAAMTLALIESAKKEGDGA